MVHYGPHQAMSDATPIARGNSIQTRKPPARRIGTPIPDSRPNRDSGIPCFPAKSGIGDSLPDSRQKNREIGGIGNPIS